MLPVVARPSVQLLAWPIVLDPEMLARMGIDLRQDVFNHTAGFSDFLGRPVHDTRNVQGVVCHLRYSPECLFALIPEVANMIDVHVDQKISEA